jgi:hypothetical protein
VKIVVDDLSGPGRAGRSGRDRAVRVRDGRIVAVEPYHTQAGEDLGELALLPGRPPLRPLFVQQLGGGRWIHNVGPRNLA